jgi:hypothetical protein
MKSEIVLLIFGAFLVQGYVLDTKDLGGNVEGISNFF